MITNSRLLANNNNNIRAVDNYTKTKKKTSINKMMKDFNGKGSQHNSKQGIQSKEEIRAGNGSGILRERRGALWSH